MEVFVLPLTSVSATNSRFKNAFVMSADSPGLALTRISISPIVSWPRRSEPAYCASTTCGSCDSVSTTNLARMCASPIRTRPPEACMKTIAFWIFSSFFLPMRGSASSSPVFNLAFRESRSVTPPFCQKREIVFGPSPEMFSRSSRPSGIRAMSSSRAMILPVSKNSAIFSALAFPTPCSLESWAMSGPMVETSCDNSSSVRATRALAFTLNPDSPRMVRMSAMREKIAASFWLLLAILF